MVAVFYDEIKIGLYKLIAAIAWQTKMIRRDNRCCRRKDVC